MSVSMYARLGTVDTRLDAIDTRLGDVDRRLLAESVRVEMTLRQELREEAISTRRHFDVVAESVRDDIRIIAEGLVTLDAKVETMRKV